MTHQVAFDFFSYLMDNDDPGNSNMNCDTTDESFTFVPSDVKVAAIPGSSMMRDILEEEIAACGLSRPVYNLVSES